MFKKITLITSLVTACLFSSANAAEVSVSKLRINLENGQTTDFLNLNNQSTTNKESFEVTLQKWSQKPAEKFGEAPIEVLENSSDIIVSPKTLVVLPGKDKVVRLIVNKPEEVKKNYSYRLIINQLPNKEVGSSTNTVNLLFKISLPIFIYQDAIKTVGKMKIENNIVTQNGKKYLSIKNNDTQHIQISGINSGEKKFGSSQYLLPGSSVAIEIPSNVSSNNLEIMTDKGNLKITN